MKNHTLSKLVIAGAALAAGLLPGLAQAATESSACSVQFTRSAAAWEPMPVIGVQHEIVAPRDAAAASHRQQRPVQFVIRLGKSTPYFVGTLMEDPVVGDVLVECAGEDGLAHYSVRLENASVAGIRAEMLNNKYDQNSVMIEELTIAYEKFHREL